MKRRGIRPEAIRRYWVESGIKPVDIEFSWQNLYGMNRDIIDTDANRYFYVEKPAAFDIDGIDVIEGAAPKHPDHPERGERKFKLDAPRTVYLAEADSELFEKDKKIRLKDLCNIEYGKPAKYIGNDVSILKTGVRAVQWVAADGIDATLVMPDGTVQTGKIESDIVSESNDMVQLERIGFVRIEKKDPKSVSMIFAHR
jgi:glutamyl-tRNA synthetase